MYSLWKISSFRQSSKNIQYSISTYTMLSIFLNTLQFNNIQNIYNQYERIMRTYFNLPKILYCVIEFCLSNLGLQCKERKLKSFLFVLSIHVHSNPTLKHHTCDKWRHQVPAKYTSFVDHFVVVISSSLWIKLSIKISSHKFKSLIC